MKKEFTKHYVIENQGCYHEYPGKVQKLSFMQKENISILNILNSEIHLKDGLVGYILEEYQINPKFEHLFETVMFLDLEERSLSFDEQIKEALLAPTPKKVVKIIGVDIIKPDGGLYV